VSRAAWVGIFWLAVVVINLFGVKGYGEAEFVFSIIKITAVRPSRSLKKDVNAR
jgi:amino acid transporter